MQTTINWNLKKDKSKSENESKSGKTKCERMRKKYSVKNNKKKQELTKIMFCILQLAVSTFVWFYQLSNSVP